MVKKRGKQVSFDAMVKFFMIQYEIPTKRDVDRLMAKMERLEMLITASQGPSARRGGRKSSGAKGKGALTASDMVLLTIRRFKQGASFSDIQSKTGFGEKKLRNIIFRLNKLGKIKRKSRGVYIAV
ncbi:hypothetical protein D3OALGA1CA_3135 [Olavius algarvensis associated proteobacterium Delta 3]|nr:hypothetical protein D3OALGA1CA_3135 [Olavius algarvensis associated proteobacterium Delta 3]CAB5159167.1 hypothetical protein D3OALGB2SA_5317 [Olavius algarvensis associated proteobacterium Delta 3]